jgi:hypothetical protein
MPPELAAMHSFYIAKGAAAACTGSMLPVLRPPLQRRSISQMELRRMGLAHQ